MEMSRVRKGVMSVWSCGREVELSRKGVERSKEEKWSKKECKVSKRGGVNEKEEWE